MLLTTEPLSNHLGQNSGGPSQLSEMATAKPIPSTRNPHTADQKITKRGY